MTATTQQEPVLAANAASSSATTTSSASPPSSLPTHQPALEAEPRLLVHALDMEAQGVAHRADGKVVFIDGALPTELVSVQVQRSKSSFDKATLSVLHRESSQRVRPLCPHFGLHASACGGCKMQHLQAAAQVAIKQRVLEDNLWHIGKVKPETVLRPIEGPTWGYRYRARLSVRYVRKKAAVLIGFHERKSHFVADMQSCPVLPTHVSAMLMPLRALIASMDIREAIPQLELAVGDTQGQADTTALVLRHLQPLSQPDKERLRAFAAQHPGLQWWLQAKGPDTVVRLDELPGHTTAPLSYRLPEFGITMPFRPTDFTQVNPHINRVLVSKALALLHVQSHERVIDWFCGLGNFTLALATQAKAVLGVEGAQSLVQRATENWHYNQEARGELGTAQVNTAQVASLRIANLRMLAPTEFVVRNLFEMEPQALAADGVAQKWLIDPPREGAYALVQALAALVAAPQQAAPMPWQPPQRIVYVSCNPATLARDAQVLVHLAGYRCTHAGVVNMFAHTAHVESIAVFERG